MVSSDLGDYPELGGGGLSHSAILLGRLVAASSLTASDRNDIQDFMSLCRQAQLQHYIAAVKSTGAELGLTQATVRRARCGRPTSAR